MVQEPGRPDRSKLGLATPLVLLSDVRLVSLKPRPHRRGFFLSNRQQAGASPISMLNIVPAVLILPKADHVRAEWGHSSVVSVSRIGPLGPQFGRPARPTFWNAGQRRQLRGVTLFPTPHVSRSTRDDRHILCRRSGQCAVDLYRDRVSRSQIACRARRSTSTGFRLKSIVRNGSRP